MKQISNDKETLSQENIDVKEHEYFTSKGYSDEHMGSIAFAYEENIMNWIFSKNK